MGSNLSTLLQNVFKSKGKSNLWFVSWEVSMRGETCRGPSVLRGGLISKL